MDKKLKLTIIIGFVLVIAVPSLISLGYVILNSEILNIEKLIDVSSSTELVPTPNSNISLGYLIQENQNENQYHYSFIFTFTIYQGVEQNFIYNGRVFNETQLYLTVKANYDLEFYTYFYVLNMTEFQNNNTLVEIEKGMDSPKRFENLIVKIEFDSISEDEHVIMGIGGGRRLYFKEKVITAEDAAHYSGNMHFWINENNYNLSYAITSNYWISYTLNSCVLTTIELQSGYIQIIGTNGTQGFGIGALGIPCFPWASPGYYSSQKNITFSQQYPHIRFEFNVAVNFGGAEVEYEIIPLSEIKDEELRILRNTLLIATGSAILLYIIGLSCMINQEQKYGISWYRRT